MDLMKTGCEGADGMICPRTGARYGTLWKWWWTFGFQNGRGISWVSERLLASQKRLWSMELVWWSYKYMRILRELSLSIPTDFHLNNKQYWLTGTQSRRTPIQMEIQDKSWDSVRSCWLIITVQPLWSRSVTGKFPVCTQKF
jgi:hypothetical protein